ncbi:MAG: hypothetical protein SYC29_02980 [Planctomycetota bacterium]|nr:hypothetical protein [Planctomycetota bacterium]
MRGRRKIGYACGVLAAAIAAAAVAAGSVIYVDAAAPDGGDGSSWVTAFNDLQDALDAAVANDEIWVAAGVYTPTEPNGDRAASFELVDAVPVFGGFAGWEEELGERDWVLNETILSGDLNGDDGPDFANNDENSFHVVSAVELPNLAWLDGFTVTGGNANVGWYPNPTSCGGGLYADSSILWIQNSTFRINGALCEGGALYAREGDTSIVNCAFEANTAGHGGAIRHLEGGSLSLEGCAFSSNGAGVGGALDLTDAPQLSIVDCLFVGNEAEAACGAIYANWCYSFEVLDCAFLDNRAVLMGGAMMAGSDYFSAIDCIFAVNSAPMYGGALGPSTGERTFINCVFSRNRSERGGGVYCCTPDHYINCSFSNNEGCGVMTNWEAEASADNCIFWGNTPEQIEQDPEQPGGSVSVRYSDIQGGWSGEGNINADPLFVQPMADDLRLGFGSPCVNAGDNDAVPPYIEFDILGNDRFIDGIVDMGACEGQYEVLPPAAVEYDLDRDEFTMLIPRGGDYNPVNAAGAMMVNTNGPDDATAQIIEYGENLHPGGEGFTVVGTNLRAETSLADGQSRIQVFIPFDASDLDGADPALLDVTYYDEDAGTWGLAVSHNTGDSPDHDGPIGDRIIVIGGDDWGVSHQLGDWGVYWDPQEEKGFAWANVDYEGDFAFGEPLYAPDCAQPPDGFVGSEDLNALLGGWSDGLGPFDVNNDGTVNVVDLLIVLGAWGPAP